MGLDTVDETEMTDEPTDLTEDKPSKCDLCYKTFASHDRLTKHMAVHGSEEAKPLQCMQCGKRFLNNSALACHIKVHSDENGNYDCPICGAPFNQVRSLTQFFSFSFVMKVTDLSGGQINEHCWVNTFLFRSNQHHPCLCLGPLKCFLTLRPSKTLDQIRLLLLGH